MTYFYGIVPIKYSMTDEVMNDILNTFSLPKFPEKEHVFNLQAQSKGDPIKLKVLLNDFSVHLTRQQKQFIRLNISNNSGDMRAVIWDNNGNVDKYKPLLEEHSVFNIEGFVHEFNQQKSITINTLSPLDADIDPALFLPATDASIEPLTIELFAYLNELK